MITHGGRHSVQRAIRLRLYVVGNEMHSYKKSGGTEVWFKILLFVFLQFVWKPEARTSHHNTVPYSTTLHKLSYVAKTCRL